MQINLDAGSEKPLYQQLADAICTQVQSGALAGGQQLPTVRELAAQLSVAHGTVKHAYADLMQQGVLEMRQGRGTFVRARQSAAQPGKKERAMRAIDAMLDELESLPLSPREIEIFFELKLRERAGEAVPHVGVVAGSPEELYEICRFLDGFSDIRVSRLLRSDVLRSPRGVDRGVDVVVADAAHCEELRLSVPDYSKVTGVSLQPSLAAVAEIARAASGRMAVLAVSEQHLAVMCGVCREAGVETLDAAVLGDNAGVRRALEHADALLIPEGCQTLCGSAQYAPVAAFRQGDRTVIPFRRELDGGSVRELEKRVENMRIILKDTILS